ncbi:hypothetical protein TUBRATIS_001750 [Tubulinosema ratisbonensis]|uniref:Uncharacterized protein n=1 Tax=Tubulinosema ratisbonensis TaxID=291195 RepID=A0A437AHT0_9MICR|nr:hypothetical protein TUBRATIS_29270 [Tubulinosema ratisbonensis]RVD93292.1 hypothetical protein TUBRATIS_001750 [Tubulinosema ratisbonensis]
MFHNINIIFPTILKYFISFLFLMNESNKKSNVNIFTSDSPYKCVRIGLSNLSILNEGYWILIITEDIKKTKEKIERGLKFINVAVLEIDSFENAMIASKFMPSTLPKGVVFFNGEVVKSFHKNYFIQSYNFWRALDIYLSAISFYYYDLLGKFFTKLINEGGITYTCYNFGEGSTLGYVVFF